MSSPARQRGRAQRVLDGIWRLRLPLPWTFVPHGNVWALRAGDGIVLIDTGVHRDPGDRDPGSWADLEHAMLQVGLAPADIRLLVCTHAHSDHYGQAATIVERTGCELWMHPNHRHATETAADPEAALEQRLEAGRKNGVPAESLNAYQESRSGEASLVAAVVLPDRELVDGVQVDTDVGSWRVYETPGHAPSHVCLHQPERELLISGDHLLGVVSPFYEYGYTPDPVGEFLDSLDVIEPLGARLCLAGHGRPFREVPARIEANRKEVAKRIDGLRDRLSGEARTAYELVPPEIPAEYMIWALTEVRGYLTYLERRDEAVCEADAKGIQRWRPAGHT